MRRRTTIVAAGTLLAVAALLVAGVDDQHRTLVRKAFASRTGAPASAALAQQLQPREGFTVTLYAGDVENARRLLLTPDGDLLVSQPRLGRVLLLRRDADGNGHPDARVVLLSGLRRPHGLDLNDGWLYVAELDAIGRVRFDSGKARLDGDYRHVLEGLPDGSGHSSRSVRAGPDGWLYVTVGSSCNACAETHPWRAVMLRLRPDGSEVGVHATGLRNSVGFDWAPWSGELFATDNGRDLLGDDFPPCELNRIVAGGFYGWPVVNGNGVPDPDNGAGQAARVASAIAPAHAFRAHNAPLGITFLRAAARPPALRRAALVALHGSWNRSEPDGYRVALLQWDASGAIRESVFLDGFLRDGKVIGRPVDVAEAPDGSVFVSDDYAGAVYRVAPLPSAAGPAAASGPAASSSSRNSANSDSSDFE